MDRLTTALEDFLQDSRYALRGISRNKAFSALILLVLALGIGVNRGVLHCQLRDHQTAPFS
jgi:hypothetical protein